ncbi:hypothetical protein AVEN_250784-1 [Araneus ventricosus]|uniref:Uncharacterized protein n=1 Tax=Araneus ventricosus TaxID=182803 RepID=A0A4Y2UWL3_ARAVE|nr:hypothetical protein AVEN_250784-1 [Araneus ventricosus]
MYLVQSHPRVQNPMAASTSDWLPQQKTQGHLLCWGWLTPPFLVLILEPVSQNQVAQFCEKLPALAKYKWQAILLLVHIGQNFAKKKHETHQIFSSPPCTLMTTHSNNLSNHDELFQ